MHSVCVIISYHADSLWTRVEVFSPSVHRCSSMENHLGVMKGHRAGACCVGLCVCVCMCVKHKEVLVGTRSPRKVSALQEVVDFCVIRVIEMFGVEVDR